MRIGFLHPAARLPRYQVGEVWPLFMCRCGWVYDYNDREAAVLLHRRQANAWREKIEPVLSRGGLARDAGAHEEIGILAKASYHLQQSHTCENSI